MKLYLVLAMLAVVAVGLEAAPIDENDFAKENDNPHQCRGIGRMVRQFSNRKEDTFMPCKYHALSQTKCGSYLVNLAPGNVYLHPKYRLDSLWLGIKDIETSEEWEGRTDNKIAVKFINGWKDHLFIQKDGGLSTDDVLAFGRDSSSTWIEAKNEDFRVTFVPWDPTNKEFPMSGWIFECFRDDTSFVPAGYPQQICGGNNTDESEKRRELLGLKGREEVILYDVFTDTSIAQTNPKCDNATRIMTEVCTDQEQRALAITTCHQMLTSSGHTKCLTKYSCDPMDVFVDCLDWVCGGFNDPFACERVGRGIDLCREFKSGNLTAKVKDADCYNDFLPIINT